MAFSLRDYLQKQWRKRTDPIVVFPQLTDLETAASERGWPYEEVLPASIQVCPGAHALAEDFLQWVERGPHLVRVHRDAWRGLNFGRNWAAYLHSYRRYPMDKVFRCVIPEATVVSVEGAVLTDRGEYATEANYIVPSLRRSQVAAPRTKPKEGRFISLITVWGEKNMGHFFFDAMLRVTVFDRLEDYRFLVPAELQPWHRGLFEVTGIQPHQLVPAERPFTRVE